MRSVGKRCCLLAIAALAAALSTLSPSVSAAQSSGPPPPGDRQGPPDGHRPPPPPGGQHRPPGSHSGSLEKAMSIGPPGRWWNDTAMAQRIGISSQQQQRMDQVFDQHRPQLIDLNAAVQKQEALLEPLLAADPLNDDQVLAQINRVVEARATLERASSAMLLGLRKVLTGEQWRKLQADDPSIHRQR